MDSEDFDEEFDSADEYELENTEDVDFNEYNYDSGPDNSYGRPISERTPPSTGLHGVFEYMLRGGGPGIDKPLILGKNNRGDDIIIPASAKYDDYLLIDTAAMTKMTEGAVREIEDVGVLNRRVLAEIYPKNDVSKLRSWYRWNGTEMELAPKLADMCSPADIVVENEYQLEQNELEKHFCDNFSVQFRRIPKEIGGLGFENSKVTGDKLLSFFGWECGITAHHARKYYLTHQKLKGSERTKPIGKPLLYYFKRCQCF